MPYTPLAHVTTGDLATASLQNALLDNVSGIALGSYAITPDLASYVETRLAITVSANTIALDLALASYFDFQATANITTTTITNIPASGRYKSFTMRVKGDGSARTWAWFDSTVVWSGGVAPTRTSTNNKYDRFLFETVDGGTTWFGYVIGQNL